jgi:hypothetical protein
VIKLRSVSDSCSEHLLDNRQVPSTPFNCWLPRSPNYRDVEGLTRVLVRLRVLGFGGVLSYKKDGATLAGV